MSGEHANGDAPLPIATPWLNVRLAGTYIGRSPRFLARCVHRGELRAARIGGRSELYFLAAWLDDYMQQHATPIMLPARRRA